MIENESNWFSNWEQQLPKPDELIPLSQTLITPNLAIAFDIFNHHQQPPPEISPPPPAVSGEFDSSDIGGDEPARTLKRPRLVWTPQLHKRFVDAVAQLGIKNAVPKTIMQLMNVDGLTRENVASHLQKYRLYLKRMQGLSSGVNNGGAGFGDSVTDRLFASSPVPPHFLHQSQLNCDNVLQYMPVAAIQQQQQQQHLHAQFGSSFLSRQNNQSVRGSYGDDSANDKRALSLFPIGDD
ncbi:hypothetical protein QVD17_22518 [Tagetes erecta]|uniref:HTH myb-type domain-containing protein n=1 Tax=Tagetes erecta TaxID=13708 RepID=A0AAD8KDG2_TARER|nr:hypothetical protein QVD17_22518 [Tagetes erecta]